MVQELAVQEVGGLRDNGFKRLGVQEIVDSSLGSTLAEETSSITSECSSGPRQHGRQWRNCGRYRIALRASATLKGIVRAGDSGRAPEFDSEARSHRDRRRSGRSHSWRTCAK